MWYGLEFVEGGAVLDLGVLVVGEEGGPEAADDGFGVPVLDREGCHLHLDVMCLINITNQKAIKHMHHTGSKGKLEGIRMMGV